jgi:hypothetical protein
MKRNILPALLLLLATLPAGADERYRGYYGHNPRLEQSIDPEERRSLRRDVDGYSREGYPDREGMQQRRQRMQERLPERLRRADGDNDGGISREEARRGMPGLSRGFGRIDRDGDGVISPEEMRSTRERRD